MARASAGRTLSLGVTKDGMGWDGARLGGMEQDGMEQDGMEWEGMGKDGVEWDGKRWDGTLAATTSAHPGPPNPTHLTSSSLYSDRGDSLPRT